MISLESVWPAKPVREFESRSLRRMSEFKANKAKASSSNLALSAFADGVSITFQLLLSTKLRNPTPLFPHFNNLYLIEVANRHRLTTSETNQYFMNLNLWLQFRRDGVYPGLDAGVGLVILVDVVEGQTNELAVNHSLGVVESVAVSLNGTDEFGSTVLDAVVEFAYSAYEGVAVRRAVTTAEAARKYGMSKSNICVIVKTNNITKVKVGVQNLSRRNWTE